MNNMGWIYQNGEGVAQDYDKAREWYERAADKGEPTAMNNMGGIYRNGQGWQARRADGGGTRLSDIGTPCWQKSSRKC
jgi:TPR repeat protein